jgi:small subunit ribosomal protein S13
MVDYMARLVGVDLPREKRVEIALTYIFGMGLTRSHATLKATGISPDTRVKDLQESELAQLREYIEANYKIEGDLRREIAHIQTLVLVRVHVRQLPVRRR